jgi:hypothetical protein
MVVIQYVPLENPHVLSPGACRKSRFAFGGGVGFGLCPIFPAASSPTSVATGPIQGRAYESVIDSVKNIKNEFRQYILL